MSENELSKGLGGAIEKVVPELYGDALKPAVTELGKAAGTITGLLNVALSPIRIITARNQFWEESVNKALEERFKGREGKVIEPAAEHAAPILQWLSITYERPELREMYLNLLASSMDADKVELVHPSYVEIIKQLTPLEIRFLNEFITESVLQVWTVAQVIDIHYPKRIDIQAEYTAFQFPSSGEFLEHPLFHAQNLQRLNLVTCKSSRVDDIHEFVDLDAKGLGEHFKELRNRDDRFRSGPDWNSYMKLGVYEFRLTMYGVGFMLACAADGVAGDAEDTWQSTDWIYSN